MAEQDNTTRQAVVNKLFGSVFGNVEQRIEMAPETPSQPARGEETEDASGNTASSPVHLSTARGTKIDFIRVVNCLYELGFFTDDKGGRISKKEVMTALGSAVNVDLSTYDNDLSRSLSDSTKLDKHLAIFERLRAKMEEVFNNYGG